MTFNVEIVGGRIGVNLVKPVNLTTGNDAHEILVSKANDLLQQTQVSGRSGTAEHDLGAHRSVGVLAIIFLSGDVSSIPREHRGHVIIVSEGVAASYRAVAIL